MEREISAVELCSKSQFDDDRWQAFESRATTACVVGSCAIRHSSRWLVAAIVFWAYAGMTRVWGRTGTLAILLAASGCAQIRHTTDYTSAVRHENLPLRSTVTVLVAPQLRKQMEDDPARLEGLRQMYQSALRRDLADNGPLRPVVEDPEARLQVVLRQVRQEEVPLAVMTWFLAPTWLFGVPFYWGRVELGAEVTLTSAFGDTLYREKLREQCTRLQGLYYGYEDLSFGCPGRRIAERIRERMSLERSDILARAARNRTRVLAMKTPLSTKIVRRSDLAVGPTAVLPDAGEASPPKILGAPAPVEATRSAPGPATAPAPAAPIRTLRTAPAAERQDPIAAVFTIRDMSGRFDARTVEQLTEYLSARVASTLRYKLVPREEIRRRLAEDKQESFRACYDESCQIEIGKALAANKSVAATLLQVGNRCAFTATVYDLKTEAADLATSVQTSCSEDALLDGVEKVVRGLVLQRVR